MATALRLDSSIAFDRGIDRITYTKGEAVQRMPGAAELPPAEIGMQSELDTLISQKTLADHLMESLRPQLSNRSLLIPSEFKAGLANAAQAFGDAAARLASETAGQKRNARARSDKDFGRRSSAADAGVLRRASNELKEARKLVDYKDEKSSELFLG